MNTGDENKLATPIPTPLPDLTVDYMQTFGTYMKTKKAKCDANLWFYGQTGKRNFFNVSVYDASINFNYALTENFKAGLGYEFLSGKSQTNTSTNIKSSILFLEPIMA